MMKPYIIGWDIGGAHCKAAILNPDRQISHVLQQPCPLWKGLAQLQQAVTTIKQQLPPAPTVHVITMTGELVDCFADRDEGVQQIIDTMSHLLVDSELWVFAGSQGFIAAQQVSTPHYAATASANWLASASFAAQKLGSALFVDIGSTTTDILLLHNGQVITQAYSDYQRLRTQELVYTGIVRTAVMAVTQTVLDEGDAIGVMAEYFATMADVYRVTGELNEAHDQTDTADGAEKSVLASARRLSRMIGCDFFADDLVRWQDVARHIRVQQLEKIYLACQHRLSLYAEFPQNAPLIAAGVGQFLVRDVAILLGRDTVDFAHLCPPTLTPSALSSTDCAPAVAVACLFANKLTD